MEIPGIEFTSVKVMRSHDYCHFEVNLGTNGRVTPEQVDELRKTAARLADKAVEQYKIAKDHAYRAESLENSWTKNECEEIRKMPETERSPEQQAKLKAFDDMSYRARRAYDYQDDWRADDEDQDQN